MVRPFPDATSPAAQHSKKLRTVRSEDDGDKLETFSFEASAGRQSGTSVVPEIVPADRQTSGDANNLTFRPIATSAGLGKATPGRLSVARRSSPSRGFYRQRIPAWAVSLLAHAALLLVLALLSFSTFHQRFDFSLAFETDDWEEPELELVAFDTLDDLDALADASPIPELEPLPFSPASGTQISESVLQANAQVAGAPTLGLGGGMLQLGSESVSDALPKQQPLTATFFGTEVEGKRIVYVVDNSGGMRGGELEALVDELLKSVKSLGPDQRFYVIFYSDMLYPLFFPRPVDRFVQPDDRMKKHLSEWLAEVEFCLGNVVDEAVAAAASIRPDVVYLLTDGDLDSTRDQRRMAYLLNTRGRRFKIHTFGMGTGERGKAAEKLKLVAEKNRGTFRAIEITAEYEQRAETANRPYHSKSPGRVWGQAVGGAWGR